MKRFVLVLTLTLSVTVVVATTPAGAVGPGQGRIAFMRLEGGYAHIYSVRPDGSDERQLTSGAVSDRPSSWSPDGTMLAFDRTPVGASKRQMWIVSADGSQSSRLGRGMGPIWSPNGRRLAFTNVGRHLGELWFVRADGTHRHAATLDVCGDPSLGQGGPSDWYSSNGSWIVLAWSCSTNPNVTSIYRVRPDGSHPTLLVDAQGDSYFGGRMSPDGTTVAYSRSVSGEDGGSGDIARRPGGSSYFTHQFDGFQCQVDGVYGWYCEAQTPTWSPDGTQVAYGAEGYDGVRWIALINADDQTAPVRIVQGWAPVWSGAAS